MTADTPSVEVLYKMGCNKTTKVNVMENTGVATAKNVTFT